MALGSESHPVAAIMAELAARNMSALARQRAERRRQQVRGGSPCSVRRHLCGMAACVLTCCPLRLRPAAARHGTPVAPLVHCSKSWRRPLRSCGRALAPPGALGGCCVGDARMSVHMTLWPCARHG